MTAYRHKARGTPGGYQLKTGTLAQLTAATDILNTAERGDGVAGTFSETARNTDPGVSNVRDGTAYTIRGVSKTGTLDVAGGTVVRFLGLKRT